MTKKQDTKLQDLEQKVTELDNQLKRAVADYQNLEKRIQEGRSELTKWGTGELLVKILPTLDHLETVVQSGRQVLSEQSESKEWLKGVELAVKEFRNVLQSEGLNEIPTDGEFNPAIQEAVDTRVDEDNKILEVVRRGYTLNGKILRPAQVVVGRQSEDHPERAERVEGSK